METIEMCGFIHYMCLYFIFFLSLQLVAGTRKFSAFFAIFQKNG